MSGDDIPGELTPRAEDPDITFEPQFVAWADHSPNSCPDDGVDSVDATWTRFGGLLFDVETVDIQCLGRLKHLIPIAGGAEQIDRGGATSHFAISSTMPNSTRAGSMSRPTPAESDWSGPVLTADFERLIPAYIISGNNSNRPCRIFV